jgi:hypothetical protein
MAEAKPPDPEEWVPTANDSKKLSEWAHARRTEAEAIRVGMSLRNSYPSQQEVEELRDKLGALNSALARSADPVVSRAKLVDALKSPLTPLYGAWIYYLQMQAQLDQKRRAQEEENERQRRRQLASTVAVQYRNSHHSPSGTVVTGLVDLSTATTWAGPSGSANRAIPVLHPVMSALLAKTNAVAEWPTAGCGEVNVMNSYLYTTTYNSIDAVPKNNLVFHSETYDDGKPKQTAGGKVIPAATPGWKGRGACPNCKQWMALIGAGTI